MKIEALNEIFIGDIAIGALVEEVTEEAPKLVIQQGFWVLPPLMKVVTTRPLDLKGSVGTIGQMVLGVMDPVNEINEGDTPIVATMAAAENKALREHEFERRLEKD
ncbi:hypothetical protein OUZ56_003542 [Daphnia magna]|uniref:Uncharacterized protein n=1 Tax=Daphnia magna TaxID=35525 RepID=A0ABR0A911_9CRUS|nr:hypothetical protein OUZ56_003542 [Daphnia magna]